MKYLARLNAKYDNVALFDEDLEDYQREAVVFLKNNPKSALFIDTGLGKTAICLRLIRDLIDDCEINKILIIAPLKVAHQTWGDEIKQWQFSAGIPFKLVRDENLVEASLAKGRIYNEKYNLSEKDIKKIEKRVETRLKKELLNNPQLKAQSLKDRLFLQVKKEYLAHLRYMAQIKEANRLLLEYEKQKPCIIHIINQENVEWLVDAMGNDWFYDCVIYDESDNIKDAKTKRWKALDSIKNRLKRFYQLTATPAAESYLGLFAQIKLLDGGKRLGKTMTEYKERYFIVNPYNYDTKLRDGADKEIGKAISDITLVMKQEDYLPDIPPYEVEDVLYELSDSARAAYEDMSRKGQIVIGDKIIAAEQAVSVLQKMMQIAAGFVYESEETINDFGSFITNRTIHYLHTDKIEALKRLIERFPDENLLISYYHQGSLELLQYHFPEAVKMDRKGSQKKAWNEGKIKMLLMHPKSGAHGLNLQKGGNIVINYDVYFSYGNFYQFLRRLARRGQKAEKVLVFNLLARATYDVVVKKECWVEKRDNQNVLFELLKGIKRNAKSFTAKNSK